MKYRELENKKLWLEFGLFILGIIPLGLFYREHLWRLLSESGFPLLTSQCLLIALCVASERSAAWLTRRSDSRYAPSPAPARPKRSTLVTAGLLVPLLFVPVLGLVTDLVRSSTPVPILKTLFASTLLGLPFAYLITFVYGLPIYSLMLRLNALRPWSLAVLAYAFVYVGTWGWPLSPDPLKCLPGPCIAVGIWLFVREAEKRQGQISVIVSP